MANRRSGVVDPPFYFGPLEQPINQQRLIGLKAKDPVDLLTGRTQVIIEEFRLNKRPRKTVEQAPIAAINIVKTSGHDLDHKCIGSKPAIIDV